MRFRLRRMMIACAALGVVLGLGIEASRLARRFLYCREMARRHCAWISYIRESDAGDLHRVRELDAVVTRLAGLGPRPLDELVRDSGNPNFTAWFLKGKRRELLTGGEERPFTPRELIDHIEYFWGRNWRERADSAGRSMANHSVLQERYFDASCKPWVKIPSGPPLEFPN